MVLRIHIEKKDSYFEPTDIFQITGFVDYTKLNNLLVRVKDWIRDPRHYFSLCDSGSVVSFFIGTQNDKYDFLLLDIKDDKIPANEVEEFVSSITEIPLTDILARNRHFAFFKPRAVLFAALRFFSKLSLLEVGKRTNYNHATILNAGKSLSQFLHVQDGYTQELVNKIALHFENPYFIEVTYINKYPR